jgi:hypothetical protein
MIRILAINVIFTKESFLDVLILISFIYIRFISRCINRLVRTFRFLISEFLIFIAIDKTLFFQIKLIWSDSVIKYLLVLCCLISSRQTINSSNPILIKIILSTPRCSLITLINKRRI